MTLTHNWLFDFSQHVLEMLVRNGQSWLGLSPPRLLLWSLLPRVKRAWRSRIARG
jgi:hypothetical protein